MSASGPECVGEGQIAELVEDDEVAADELVCSAALASGTEFGIEVVDRARNLRAPRFVSGHAAIPALRASNRCRISVSIPASATSGSTAEAEGARPTMRKPLFAAGVRARAGRRVGGSAMMSPSRVRGRSSSIMVSAW